MQEVDNQVVQDDMEKSFDFEFFNMTLKKIMPRTIQHTVAQPKKNLSNRFNSVSLVDLSNHQKNPSKMQSRILNSQHTKSNDRLLRDNENDKENINPNMVSMISQMYNTRSQINNKNTSAYSTREITDKIINEKVKNHFRTLESICSTNELNKVIENEDVVKKKDMKFHFNKRFSMNGSRRLESRLNSINFVNLKQQFLPTRHRISDRSIYNTKNDYSIVQNESSCDSNLNVSRLKQNLDSIIEKNKDVRTNLSRQNILNVTANEKSNISIINDNINLKREEVANENPNKNNVSLYINENRNTNNQNDAKLKNTQECMSKENAKSFSNFNLLKKYLKEYTYRNNSNNTRRDKSYNINRSKDKYGTIQPSTIPNNKNDNYGKFFYLNFRIELQQFVKKAPTALRKKF